MENSLPEIPAKSAFKLDEVCALTGLKPYTLRFWETEFSQLRPIVSSFGKKLYDERDIKIIFMIKSFLFEEKVSVDEARIKIDESLSGVFEKITVQAAEEVPLSEFAFEAELQDVAHTAAIPVVLEWPSKNFYRIKSELETLVSDLKCLQNRY